MLRIPTSISRLPLLETIDIENCYNIKTIPWHLEEKGVDINLFQDNYSERRFHSFSFDYANPGDLLILNLRPIEKKQHYYQYSIKDNERKFSIKELAEYGFLKCDDTDVSELCEKIGELKGTKTINLSGAPIKALPR